MLYLGTTVLILVDLSYVSRFWTQFEAWLSMQFATPQGLKSAVGTPNARHHIIPIQNAAAQADMFRKMLVDQWANTTPLEAFEFLSKPDVTVTNQSDKDMQLPKILKFDGWVKELLAPVASSMLAGDSHSHSHSPSHSHSEAAEGAAEERCCELEVKHSHL